MLLLGYLFSLFSIIAIHGKTNDLQENIAIKGKAVQTSTLYTVANHAIDNDNFFCAYTETETNPWWRLDMSGLQNVNKVIVTNRMDCCFEQINGAEIRIGNSLENNGNNNPICAEISGIPADQSVSYSCGGMQGRYVNVVIPGDSKNLTLCEVGVYGNDSMKLGGNVVQSSLFKYWRAENAIDGIRVALGSASSCTHTNLEMNPWWRLDLLDNYYINTVTITNRDEYPERISGAEIHIGNSLENNGNSNPICAVITSIPSGATYSYSCPEMKGRYVNVVIPKVTRILTLCEVEVYGRLAVRKNFVRIKFASTDLASPENDKLLYELQSVLEVRGMTNAKLSWTEPPQRVVKQDIEQGPCKKKSINLDAKKCLQREAKVSTKQYC